MTTDRQCKCEQRTATSVSGLEDKQRAQLLEVIAEWKAIARVQSAKLHAALDEPGARERLQTVLQETKLDAPATVAQSKPYLCGDCRHADSDGIPLRSGCALSCHYESINPHAPAHTPPAASASAEQQLTDEQIFIMWGEALDRPKVGPMTGDCWYLAGIRDAERAHKIGGAA